MISINYQSFGTKGFQLRLRLYQDGETKYINVTKLLKGSVKKQHWNAKKQQFIPSTPYSEENNSILVSLKQKYQEAAINWNGSIYGLITYVEANGCNDSKMTLHDFIMKVVEEMRKNKHPDGTIKGSYEGYLKLDRRQVAEMSI